MHECANTVIRRLVVTYAKPKGCINYMGRDKSE